MSILGTIPGALGTENHHVKIVAGPIAGDAFECALRLKNLIYQKRGRELLCLKV